MLSEQHLLPRLHPVFAERSPSFCTMSREATKRCLLHWALPEQRLVICGNLRARIHEELAEVFTILQESAG